MELLTKPLAAHTTPESMRALARDHPELQEIFATLEQAIVHKGIVIDRYSLESRLIDPDSVSFLLTPIDLTNEEYAVAAEAAAQGMIGLNVVRNPVLLTQANRGGLPYEDPFWDTGLKGWLDHLERALGASSWRTVRGFRDSDESLARALLYLELGDLLNCPIHVTASKRRWLELLSKSIKPDLHRWVSSVVDTALRERLVAIEQDVFTDDAFALPPLSDYLVRDAVRTKRSLIDVATDLRELPEAQAYRDWLAELGKQAVAGRPGRIERAKKLQEISNLAQEWARHLNSKHRVTHVVRKASLRKLPKFGWLFDVMGLGEFALKDPILNKQRDYRYFVSQWFE